jgi:hypothetical protein
MLISLGQSEALLLRNLISSVLTHFRKHHAEHGFTHCSFGTKFAVLSPYDWSAMKQQPLVNMMLTSQLTI